MSKRTLAFAALLLAASPAWAGFIPDDDSPSLMRGPIGKPQPWEAQTPLPQGMTEGEVYWKQYLEMKRKNTIRQIQQDHSGWEI